MELVRLIAELVAAAGLAAACLRVGLMVRGAKPAPLPDPAQYGHPMAGFASVRDAHAALTRQGSTARPKFKD